MPIRLLQRFLHKVDRKAAIKAISAIVLFIVLGIMVSRLIGEDTLQTWVEQAGIWGPVVLIARKAFAVIVVPFAGSITYIAAGSLYGLWKAALLALIGNAIGISTAFRIGRKRGIQAVRRFVGKEHIKEIKHLISHLTNLKTFTITRLVLFPLEDLINYAGGMSKIPFRYFFIISMLIITALSLVPILFGHMII